MTESDSFMHFVYDVGNSQLRQAFYNTVALVVAALAGLALVVVYLILENFIRPLLWALVFGTFLHPIKLFLSHNIKLWLDDVGTDGWLYLLYM